jgi:hypothetical protein
LGYFIRFLLFFEWFFLFLKENESFILLLIIAVWFYQAFCVAIPGDLYLGACRIHSSPPFQVFGRHRAFRSNLFC